MLLDWYVGLITRPIVTLREIARERPVGLGFLTVLIVVAANGLISFGLGINPETFEPFSDEEVSIGLGVAIIGALLFVGYVAVLLGFFSVIIHLISKLFGGDGAYRGILAGLMFLSILSLIPVVPNLLDVLVRGDDDSSVFAAIGTVAGLAVAVWSIILTVILIRENYQIGAGMAVLSAIASFIATVIVGTILFFALLIIWVALIIALSLV